MKTHSTSSARQAESISVGTARSRADGDGIIQLRLHDDAGDVFALSSLPLASAVDLAEGILAGVARLQAAAAGCAGSA